MNRFLRDIKNYLMFQLFGDQMSYRLTVVNSRKHLLQGKDGDGNTVYLSKIVDTSDITFTLFDANMNILCQKVVWANTYEEDMAGWSKRLEYGVLAFKRYLFDTNEFYTWLLVETEKHDSLSWVFGEEYSQFKALAGDDIDILCSSYENFKKAYPECA